VSLVIRGGTLLTMEPGPGATRGDMLVRGRQIAAVGSVATPPDAEVIDASGCYVMPGLVQVHVHLVQTLVRGLAEGLSLGEADGLGLMLALGDSLGITGTPYLDVASRTIFLDAMMLVGGAPMDGPRYIWWNFVASSRERIDRARDDWAAQRFAKVPGETEFIPLPDY